MRTLTFLAAALLCQSALAQKIELKWEANPDATGYRIYRSSERNAVGDLVATVTPATKTAVEIPAPKVAGTFYYRISSMFGDIESTINFANAMQITIVAGPPPKLTSIRQIPKKK